MLPVPLCIQVFEFSLRSWILPGKGKSYLLDFHQADVVPVIDYSCCCLQNFLYNLIFPFVSFCFPLEVAFDLVGELWGKLCLKNMYIWVPYSPVKPWEGCT